MRPEDKLEVPDWRMTLDELRAAIKKAREVHAYVPVNVFWIEVVVQKSKVLAALDARLRAWKEAGNEMDEKFEAEWSEEGVLLVGGEHFGPQEDAS